MAVFRKPPHAIGDSSLLRIGSALVRPDPAGCPLGRALRARPLVKAPGSPPAKPVEDFSFKPFFAVLDSVEHHSRSWTRPQRIRRTSVNALPFMPLGPARPLAATWPSGRTWRLPGVPKGTPRSGPSTPPGWPEARSCRSRTRAGRHSTNAPCGGESTSRRTDSCARSGFPP